MVSDTPETDDLARGNHVVPVEFAQDLERRHRKLLERIANSAAVYDAEDLRDQSRWSIFNEGRATALYSLLEETK